MKEARGSFQPVIIYLEGEIEKIVDSHSKPDPKSSLSFHLEKRKDLVVKLDEIDNLPSIPLGKSARNLFTITNTLPIIGLFLDLALPGESNLATFFKGAVEFILGALSS